MNRQIKWGILLQYGQMALSIIIQLIYTPIMIKILGQNQYGIYSLVSSIISYLSLLSLGFGAGYIKFYTKYKNQNDEEGIKKLNGLYLIVFCIMGAVSLIAGLMLAFNCGIFFNSTYSSGDINIAKVLMVFLSINLAISFPASVFVSYISSQEKFIFQKLVNIGKTILSPCLCIAALFLGYGSIGMVVVTTIVSLVVDIVNVIYCVIKLKMKFSLRKPEWALLKEIAVFSIFIAINEVINQINWQTDKIVLGKIINGSAVAIYAVASTINSMYISFSTAISSVFTPTVHRIVEKNEPDTNQQLTNLFIKVGRIQFFVIMLILTGFIFFGQYFISVWAGPEFLTSYYVALLLICPVTISLIQNVGIEIQRSKNLHKFRSIAYLIMALLNVAISIWFCHLWGIIGVAIGTTISLVLCNGIIMNVYYHKKIGINILKFWKEILKAVPSLLFPIVIGVLIMVFYNFKGLFDFIGFVILYVITYGISIYLFGLNRTEKEYINRPLKILLKRKSKKQKDEANGG